jgi:hypothetical protein
MHKSILLGLWAGVSFVLYKIISSIILSRRHAAIARQLGCQPAHPAKQAWYDPLGIANVTKLLKADKEYTFPQYLKGCVDAACEENGKVLSTFMGGESIFTIEPRNVQAILATQFKDFGLGERRNGNFSPLLGHGIVSNPLLLIYGDIISDTFLVLYGWRRVGTCEITAETAVCARPS